MGSVLGPFHSQDSRELPVGADLIEANGGDPVLMHGRVIDTAGAAVPGAQIDFWQATATGLYPQQDPSQPAQNLRMKMTTGAAIDARTDLIIASVWRRLPPAASARSVAR